MRKLLFLTMMSALSVMPVLAADRSQALLKELDARVAALGDYRVAFEVRAEGNVSTGTYSVSGDRYHMHTDGYDVLSDGVTSWEVNHADREVLVDRVDPSSGNILTNPTRAFNFAPETFESAMQGGEIVLTPREKGGSLKSIVLRLDPETGLPAELRYRQEGLQGEVVVRILRVSKGLPADTHFTFDKVRWKDYEVVDFR